MHIGDFQTRPKAIQKNEGVTDLSNSTIGSFIEIYDGVSFFSIDYLTNSIGKEFKEAYKIFAGKEASEKFERETARPDKISGKEWERKRRNFIDSEVDMSGINLASTVFNALRIMLPAKSFFFGNGFLALTNEKYFREPQGQIAFKYGDNLKVFGMLTKIGVNIGNVKENSQLGPMMTALSEVMNQMLNMLGINSQKDIAIISPLAVYVE